MKRLTAAIGCAAVLMAASAQAATISVGGKCNIFRALVSANNDASPQGFCRAGSGADVIKLPIGKLFRLTRINNYNRNYVRSGLPIIRSAITINGNDSEVRRAASAPRFNVFVVSQEGRLVLNQVTISRGQARGGAVYNAGTTILNYVTVSRNAIALHNLGALFVNNSHLINNTESAISVFDQAALDITTVVRGSTISGNVGVGAALKLAETATIIDSTISNNTSTFSKPTVAFPGYAGGISVLEHSTVTITDSTITGNISNSNGGGISVIQGSTLSLVRTIVAGNHAAGAPEIYVQAGSTVISDSNNVIGQNGVSGVVGFVPGPSTLIPNVPVGQIVDPVTGTPTPNSPVIDGVTDGTCPPNATDQDGNGDGGVACDIGAVEFDPQAPVVQPAPVTPPQLVNDQPITQPQPESEDQPVIEEAEAPIVEEVVEGGVVDITNIAE